MSVFIRSLMEYGADHTAVIPDSIGDPGSWFLSSPWDEGEMTLDSRVRGNDG